MGRPIVYIPTFYQPIFLALALVLGLASCAGTAQQIVIACETASSTTMILTVMKAQGQLSASQITRVGRAVDLIDPICGAAERPVTTTALSDLNRAILQLNGVKLAPARPSPGG